MQAVAQDGEGAGANLFHRRGTGQDGGVVPSDHLRRGRAFAEAESVQRADGVGERVEEILFGSSAVIAALREGYHAGQ